MCKYLNKILGFSRTGFDDQAQELGRIHVCVNASQRGKIARGSPEYFVTPPYLDEGFGLLGLETVSWRYGRLAGGHNLFLIGINGRFLLEDSTTSPKAP